jgi:hypothetical protein
MSTQDKCLQKRLEQTEPALMEISIRDMPTWLTATVYEWNGETHIPVKFDFHLRLDAGELRKLLKRAKHNKSCCAKQGAVSVSVVNAIPYLKAEVSK